MDIFRRTYLEPDHLMKVESYQASRADSVDRLSAVLVAGESKIEITSNGKGILDAFVGAINAHLDSRLVIVDYNEHTLGDNEQSEAMAYVQLSFGGRRVCGAGCSEDIVGASLRAVLSAIARAGVGFDSGSEAHLKAV